LSEVRFRSLALSLDLSDPVGNQFGVGSCVECLPVLDQSLVETGDRRRGRSESCFVSEVVRLVGGG